MTVQDLREELSSLTMNQILAYIAVAGDDLDCDSADIVRDVLHKKIIVEEVEESVISQVFSVLEQTEKYLNEFCGECG